MSPKQKAWNMISPELEQKLMDGNGYELSEIRDRDHLNEIDETC